MCYVDHMLLFYFQSFLTLKVTLSCLLSVVWCLTLVTNEAEKTNDRAVNIRDQKYDVFHPFISFGHLN